MRVRLNTARAGIGGSQREGDTIVVDDREGAALIASGQAYIETAMLKPKVEKAVTRHAHQGR